MSQARRIPSTARERRWQRLLDAERRRRERAEATALEWQDRFRLFLDHAPMPAFIRDGQGRHVYGNEPWAAQFERPLAELLGRTNGELFPKETALVFEASDQATRLRGEVSGLLESGLALAPALGHALGGGPGQTITLSIFSGLSSVLRVTSCNRIILVRRRLLGRIRKEHQRPVLAVWVEHDLSWLGEPHPGVGAGDLRPIPRNSGSSESLFLPCLR